ncbi:unnamed protein product [Clonostachys chloroleuca]|uniref:Uncharacterized protein n=1 Tax=Clonostachys chloroleuca TaxID=1926264 RepID=A0AA35QFQ7_9HYPO|nr:unnamed protein product [Clonostachys chloroleuca]
MSHGEPLGIVRQTGSFSPQAPNPYSNLGFVRNLYPETSIMLDLATGYRCYRPKDWREEGFSDSFLM